MSAIVYPGQWAGCLRVQGPVDGRSDPKALPADTMCQETHALQQNRVLLDDLIRVGEHHVVGQGKNRFGRFTGGPR
jgi:hypothetical protein